MIEFFSHGSKLPTFELSDLDGAPSFGGSGGLVILGDLSIQGNIKSVRSLAEPLQVAMDNGARRALVPFENKRNFLEVSGDIVERVDPVFFSDSMTAAMKALGMA